ncbi:MAG: sigma-70 family RNA polymerase sigma factor [Oceanospirillaceae bacterium]
MIVNKEDHLIDSVALVSRIAKGDKSAETLLVKKYQRSLLEMLKYRTRDISLAEDLLQDTLRIIIERLRSTGIDDPAKLTHFIHGTARNIVIAHYRKEIRRDTHVNSEIIEQAVDQSKGQLQIIITEQHSSYIRNLLNKLSIPRDREILLRLYVWEQEKLQVCQAMELTVHAFDRVVSRARKRFKLILEQ